jgi:hypothetical protein
MSKKVDLKIEAKLIGKIAYHRLMTRDSFRKRHKNAFPEVGRSQCMHHLNELRVWLRMAQLIDEAKYRMPSRPTEPYETYYAKQLTKQI